MTTSTSWLRVDPSSGSFWPAPEPRPAQPTRDNAALLRESLRGTRTQLRVRTLVESLWDQTSGRGSQVEDVLEKLEERIHVLEESEVSYLVAKVDESVRDGVNALRLLAAAAEDDLADREHVLGIFRDLITHTHPAVRLAVAEGIWQIPDARVIPDVEAALKKERVAEVRATLNHVLKILG